jgi:hypothetical protein|tara:strand:+ start:1446 stop:1799 length:354 start_codon:yes stop_codon:yes gene_type:complete
MKNILFIAFLLITMFSCGPYVKKPVASHVLAVTLEGDTILVAIDRIRPNQYINYYPIYSRPYYQPYYGNQYNYQFRYPDNRGVSSNIGNRSTPSKSVPVQSSVPDITSRPSPKVLKK